MAQPVVDGTQQHKGYQQITSLGSAVGLTPPAGSRVALIQPEGQNVRWRDDGTNPTASVGVLLYNGDLFLYSGNLGDIRLIEVAASAKVNISYYD